MAIVKIWQVFKRQGGEISLRGGVSACGYLFMIIAGTLSRSG